MRPGGHHYCGHLFFSDIGSHCFGDKLKRWNFTACYSAKCSLSLLMSCQFYLKIITLLRCPYSKSILVHLRKIFNSFTNCAYLVALAFNFLTFNSGDHKSLTETTLLE